MGIAGLSRVVPVAATLDESDDALPDVLLPEGFAQSFGPLRARARECSRASKDVSAARRLSLTRAQAVKSALVAGGLTPTRIDLRPLGRLSGAQDTVDILPPGVASPNAEARRS